MKSVLFINNIPSPYKIDFLNELGKYINLTVWFEAKNEKNRRWGISELGNNFKYEFLKGITFGISRHFNFGILEKLKKEKFDIYIIGGYASFTTIIVIKWLKSNNIPFILVVDGGFPKNENKFKGYLKRKLISSASYWLSSGTNCTKYLLYYGAQKDKIIEYPFSSVKYTKQDLKPLLKKEIINFKKKESLNKIVLLNVGQFIYRKGIDILLKAFKNINYNEVSLIIIGGGPLKKEYLKYIEEYNIKNIIIKDFLPKEKLLYYYKISDIFIFPTRYDIWGLVINEAMNFGLPIISSDMAGAAYDLVRDGENGYIFKAGDIDELKSKIELLIKDETKRKVFSQKSLETISRFTIKNMVTKYLEAIN
jgi:glycosyltransferase involved in cell wall biosynthesis